MMQENVLTRDQVAAYVDKFDAARVWVFGDLMLDRYFWGVVERISPEAPVPVVKIERRSSRLGGAANVAANLKALGVGVTLCGVVGDDPAGEELRRLSAEHGIDTELLLTELGRETTEKVRIIAQNQQVVRADFEIESPLSDGSYRRFLKEMTAKIDSHDVLIISDYGKGSVHGDILPDVISAWRSREKPVLVDPHVGHFPLYRAASLVTPNTREAASYYGMSLKQMDRLGELGFRMRQELELDALLITQGENGMSLFLDHQELFHIPAVAKEVYDVTGAGDTVIGTLGAALGVRLGLREAVVMANRAAGEVVKEVGTSIIDRKRLINSF
jgi:D-beta-D-heptose 7-phosphate kinase/D-beta-D-heptose 1-phosphate adenosyltransferase